MFGGGGAVERKEREGCNRAKEGSGMCAKTADMTHGQWAQGVGEGVRTTTTNRPLGRGKGGEGEPLMKYSEHAVGSCT
jgi:hypothetical protein